MLVLSRIYCRDRRIALTRVGETTVELLSVTSKGVILRVVRGHHTRDLMIPSQESRLVFDDLRLVCVETKGCRAKIGFDCPRDVNIARWELEHSEPEYRN